MGLRRGCSKTGCARAAVATLTYAYADRAVVLGQLATYAEPHSYDLCRAHAEGMTAPRGWQVVRVGGEFEDPAPDSDDLLAVADAVRASVSRPTPRARPSDPVADLPRSVAEAGATGELDARPTLSTRRRHLRILRDG